MKAKYWVLIIIAVLIIIGISIYFIAKSSEAKADKKLHESISSSVHLTPKQNSGGIWNALAGIAKLVI
ncbi:MAG: hypothetical protein WC343_04820 [Bacilli bacterium]|jgi:lipoprotein signal peptidase